jgi:hypothetical protein
VNDGDASCLRLSGAVDIFDAAVVLEGARRAAAAGVDVSASLAAAESVDTSVTQVLLALRRALAPEGRVLRLDAPPAVATIWRQAGLAGELGLTGD